MPVLIWNRNGADKTAGRDPWLDREAGASFTASRPAPALHAQTGPRHEEIPAPGRRGLFETCANPGCSSGWLHLWRSRSAPVFEGGWTCSPECTRARMEAAVRREMDGRNGAAQVRPHRIPLGLVMLDQGWITQSQLRQALEAQKAARCGRIGEWLVCGHAVPEELVTRALGLQWSCPVLGLDFHDAEGLAVMLPRLFVDAFGALPLRVAAKKILYLGFEDRLDPALALAVETITGLRVESGLVRESAFRPAHERMLKAKFPSVELVEAVSETALAQAFAKAVERTRPAASRLVRVHDCLWLRLWLRPQTGPLPEAGAIRDMIGSIGF
jgi:hypothetical protein